MKQDDKTPTTEPAQYTSWPDRRQKLQRVAVQAALVGAAAASLGCFQPAPKGRVVRIGGKTRAAPALRGHGWRDEALPDLDGLTLYERTVAGEAWQISARLEHAAVAAFAELTQLLLAAGAPSDLVERSQIASLDEVRHARRCFALASAYFGEPLTPGPFAELAGRPPIEADREALLVRLAVGSLRDGAVGEGVAALTATHAAESAEDPVIAETLRTIAREEAEHAELGWAVVRWTLAEGGLAVAEALDAACEALEIPPPPPVLPDLSDARLTALGQLPQPVLARLAEGVVAVARAQTRVWIEEIQVLAAK
ncbi:MAG: ferritin-like domain-containing protein [Deltaproteobacteria bacterium]|nr:MAG: ferritin-like domain-containing protein [Deltaproteobacteria bacterium]